MARIDELLKMLQESNGDMEGLLEDLNAALDEYQSDFQMKKDADEVAAAINNFIDKYYPDSVLHYDGDFLINLFEMESKIPKIETFDDVLSAIDQMLGVSKPKEEKKPTKTLKEMVEEKGWY